ncbi:hypothetical protein KP509_10G046300 [Ceratopteris richardii]|uniref:Fatty acid desaturase domain-containing protein n=1 Tax=Ceratopteris richardii TaxID=49495 RepID=A0A8T2U1E8_CERRI|nr:hypothetical protein KP509_10G046300 [Ceratopteris richardii]
MHDPPKFPISSSSMSSCTASFCSTDMEEERYASKKRVTSDAQHDLRTDHTSVEKQSEEMENFGGFYPAARPPFTLAQLKDAIPKHCFHKNTGVSLLFFFKDVCMVAFLMSLASLLDTYTPLHYPLYWLLQGMLLFSTFLIGHDWRISHINHHQNHGHADKDEAWHPITEKLYRSMSHRQKLFRYSPLALLSFPIYLWTRTPGKTGSHFHPNSPLFKRIERKDVMISTACWVAMLLILLALCWLFGATWIVKLYLLPYLVSVAWLGGVTYLQHHGYKHKIPWYRGKEWSYIRGGLSTVDRDLGAVNGLMHSIGTHVVHHLFPQIPHYHLVEATKAIEPILGNYYREPEKSGALPLHLLRTLVTSLQEDHYVDDEGNVVFYKSGKS